MLVIKNRIEYVKYRTELHKMTERPSTIDWKRMHNLATALELYETRRKRGAK